MHAAPMYIAETAPSQIRGRMISLKEFSTVFGMVVSSHISANFRKIISKFFYFEIIFVHQAKLTHVIFMKGGYGIGSLWITVVSGWRYMYATIIPVPVIMGIGMCWLPASPRWLLLRSLSMEKEMWRDFNRLQSSLFADLEGLL